MGKPVLFLKENIILENLYLVTLLLPFIGESTFDTLIKKQVSTQILDTEEIEIYVLFG